ncbi:hypothetical protein I4U23_022459 [Adineta vaga]|nr:hypothetical protein I4U23_022459 [Adineta vaga]
MTVAGSSGGTPGLAANLLSSPFGLALDSTNSLYIVDLINNRIQKWLFNANSGTTVAGQANGGTGSSVTTLRYPTSIVLDSTDNMYLSDTSNYRVMFWARNASSGTTIAGITGRTYETKHILRNNLFSQNVKKIISIAVIRD